MTRRKESKFCTQSGDRSSRRKGQQATRRRGSNLGKEDASNKHAVRAIVPENVILGVKVEKSKGGSSRVGGGEAIPNLG